MGKGRLEAFSDGVIAVLITIMVLEMKAPHGHAWEDLRPLLPILMSYVLSFVFLGIYWNNHHHILHAIKHVNGSIMWANLHLLFWLSLVPFTTAWMGENHFEALPTSIYGVVLLASGVAFNLLVKLLVRHHGRDSLLATAIQGDKRGLVSTGLYATAIGAAWITPWISWACYVAVALLWLVPDRRIEKAIAHGNHGE